VGKGRGGEWSERKGEGEREGWGGVKREKECEVDRGRKVDR